MFNMFNILIIGAGFVGSHLAKVLDKKYNVSVTTRTLEKKQELEKESLNVKLLDTNDFNQLSQLISSYDIIVVTLAPKCINDYKKTYLTTAQNIVKCFENSQKKVKHLIYTSSSSVYGDQKGALTTEDSPLNNTTSSGKILIETENTFLSLKKMQTKVCIFRLSEIYGPKRDLSLRVKHYSEFSAPGDGLNPTNMIHVDDISLAILFAIEHSLDGIYNLTDDEHISRKQMYDLISRRFLLPIVFFDSTKSSIHSGSKVLSNQKIKDLGFIFKYPHRIYT